MPESLQGAPTVAVMEKLSDFSFGAGSAALRGELQKLYAEESDLLGSAARDSLTKQVGPPRAKSRSTTSVRE